MADEQSGGFPIIRADPFPTFVPDTLRVGLVRSDPSRKVSVVLMNEDALYQTTESPGQIVLFETARLSLRPDIALTMARMLVKSLDLLLIEKPEQAKTFGITREIVDELGRSRFQDAQA